VISPQPTLRPGAPTDEAALLALFDEAVGWLTARGRTDQWGSRPWSQREDARRLVTRLAGSPGLVVAVEEVDGRERVNGAMVVEDHPTSYVPPAEQPELFVHLLITARTAAGRGIGALLVNHARSLCRRARVDLLRVDCFAGGEGELVRWYERQGFRATQRLDVDGWPAQVLEQRVRRFDEVHTDRLLLRHWRAEDRAPFAELNADPVVMEHFPTVHDRATSDASAERFEQHLADNGWGLWALERLDTGEFIGFTGVVPIPPDVPLDPGVEVGWRLSRAHWGNGFAPEAGRAALRVAFEALGAPRVVSFTSEANTRSRTVMSKLGLSHQPELDFDHPRFPDWPGRRHVVYAVTADQWRDAGRDRPRGAGTVGA
jgi:RimJ/RimL family protein N-acetyltransferase